MGNLTRRLGRIQVLKNDEVLITQWKNQLIISIISINLLKIFPVETLGLPPLYSGLNATLSD